MTTSLIHEGVFRGFHPGNLFSFLDIGCGGASELSFFVENYKNQGWAVGIDICPHNRWKSIASRNKRVNFVKASALYLPLRRDLFDSVVLKDLLHHISDNRLRVIGEAWRVVKNSGVLRVIEANRYHVNPILVFRSDKSHDHFTFEQMRFLKKCLPFDELYGFELLPSFSNSKRDTMWNFFVLFFWLLTTWSVGRRFIFLYLKLKEKLIQSNLTYYVLSKRKKDAN